MIERNPDYDAQGSSVSGSMTGFAATSDGEPSLSSSTDATSGESTTNGLGGTTTDATAVDASGSAGGEETCARTVLDDFEDGQIDESWDMLGNAHPVDERDGALVFELGPEAGATSLQYADLLSLSNATVVFGFGDALERTEQQVYVGLQDPERRFVVTILSQASLLRFDLDLDGNDVFTRTVDYDPVEHAYIGASLLEESTRFLVSPDGVSWHELAAAPAIGTGTTELFLTGETWMDTTGSDEARVRFVEICAES